MTGRFATDRAAIEREVRMTFFRASGPGGQHRNRTESGVRLFHPPSGITVTATERRSQHQNRELAFRRLAARLKVLNRKRRPRIRTRMPAAAHRRRLEAKKRRARLKQERARPEVG